MTDEQPAPLPEFVPVEPDSEYAILHKLLWPTGQTPNQPADPAAAPEPPHLAQYIETCEVDLRLRTNRHAAMNVENSNQSLQASTPKIRYIDLTKYKHFAVHRLQPLDKLIVREEYVEFMSHALSRHENFFLTGQPGIGKSIGTGYFLFRLLAAGQSFFFIPNSSDILYFSALGVTLSANKSPTMMGDTVIKEAIRRSWVLVDVAVPSERWMPDQWVENASCLVWTSSPNARGMHSFTKQFYAGLWYMQPWTSLEIAAITTLNLKNCDPEDVRDRFIMSGPVARSLLSKNKMNATTIEDVIKQALANDLFEFATSNIDLPCPTSHQMFLIRPAEVFDAAGKPSFIRQNRSLHFVSNYVASRTVELMEQRFDNVRKHLADALDIDATRPAAGKLVESILHRALVERKIDLPPAFGGGQVAQGLELIGNTDNFILQTRAQDHRPLYLRPQLPDFGAADAILVTETALCFLQCSLSSSHSCVGKTLLQVLDRLDTSEKIVVDSRKLLYCVVGMDEGRVKQLGREEAQKLKALQAQGLGNLSSIAVTRLRRLEVVGFTLGELMEHVELKVVEMVDGDEDCVPDEVEIQSDKGKGKGRKRRQHVVDGFGDEDDGPTTTASTGGSPKRQKDNDLNRKNRIRGRGRPTASGQQFRPS